MSVETESVEGQKEVRIPCWGMKDCPPEQRETCRAYPGYVDACWYVTGTQCDGEVQGPFEEKIGECEKCEVYIEHSAVRSPVALGFELSLVLKVALLLAVGVLIPATTFWLVTTRFEAADYAEIIENIGALELILLRVTVLSAVGQFVLVGVLIAGVALFASHRIAGPLIRFERCVREVGEGDFSQRISFRDGDQNRALPQALDVLCRRLRQRVSKAEGVAKNLKSLCENLDEISGGAGPSDKRSARLIKGILQQASDLRAAGTFGTKSGTEKL